MCPQYYAEEKQTYREAGHFPPRAKGSPEISLHTFKHQVAYVAFSKTGFWCLGWLLVLHSLLIVPVTSHVPPTSLLSQAASCSFPGGLQHRARPSLIVSFHTSVSANTKPREKGGFVPGTYGTFQKSRGGRGVFCPENAWPGSNFCFLRLCRTC